MISDNLYISSDFSSMRCAMKSFEFSAKLTYDNAVHDDYGLV